MTARWFLAGVVLGPTLLELLRVYLQGRWQRTLLSGERRSRWRPVPCGMAWHIHCKNAVIVGDAAHPMADFSSQGVSSALEDAVRDPTTDAFLNANIPRI